MRTGVVRVARLFTVGAECNDGVSFAGMDGVSFAGTYDTVTVRSGLRSFKCAATAAQTTPNVAESFGRVFATGTSYFVRAYFYFSNLPGTTVQILYFSGGAGNYGSARLTSAGVLQLFNETGTPAQVGSNSVTTIVTGQWYRIELGININAAAGSNDYLELLLNGESVASSSTLSIGTTAPNGWAAGWTQDPRSGSDRTLYVDDIALNDSTGASQTSWPADGKVVLLLPVSDNSAGSWRAGSAASAAANGALFDAINNTPPAGTVSPDGVLACISNAISGATNPNGDFNMQTYASKGINPGDTINIVRMGIAHGEDVSTNSKTGTFNMQSNPSHATDNVAQGGTNQFGPSAGGAVGAYAGGPTNWVPQWGTVFYGDVVTVGTAPVARITKTDTGTRAADCCFMGILVDYTPRSMVPYEGRRVVRNSLLRR
jgi:hypothetical protein